MPHKPFHLYKRPTRKKNKYIYYVQFYDEDGNRLSGRSTGQTTKAAAETWTYEQLKRGYIKTPKNITFGQYAQDWWTWDKCIYIKSRKLRGKPLSRSYIDTMRGFLEHHILPYFKNKRLRKINSRIIEKWLVDLSEKQSRTGSFLTPTTINHCLTCLKIMLKEAVRLEYIYKNPAKGINELKERPKRKSILNIDEVKKLFQDDSLETIWEGDLIHFTLNILAASTGMRLGEVQALQIRNVHDKYVSVVFSWDPKYGLKVPKHNSQRNIPIPSKTSYYLHELIEYSPFKDPEDFVFIDSDRYKPIRNEIILKALYKAFERIGISPEERKRRNITFHSWRHFYNTIMRGKIHDAKLRQLTGHRTLEMTEHYTHFSIDDFQDVLQIQEQFFSR